MSGWRVQQHQLLVMKDRNLDSGLEIVNNGSITKVDDYGLYLNVPGDPVKFYPWSTIEWAIPNGVATPATATLADHSGTILAGGISQEVMAANPSREYLFLQNVSDQVMWIAFGSAPAVASEPSIEFPPGSTFLMEGKFVTSDAVQIIGPGTGSSFVAKEDDSTPVGF